MGTRNAYNLRRDRDMGGSIVMAFTLYDRDDQPVYRISRMKDDASVWVAPASDPAEYRQWDGHTVHGVAKVLADLLWAGEQVKAKFGLA